MKLPKDMVDAFERNGGLLKTRELVALGRSKAWIVEHSLRIRPSSSNDGDGQRFPDSDCGSGRRTVTVQHSVSTEK